MASKYWIKLYHEILEDHKMGKLPDNLWRRVIELFLLAGEIDQGGMLPSTADIAWKLRQDAVTIRDELQQLCVTGILTMCDNDTWLVTKFADRQSAVTDKERKQRQREREKRPKYPKIEQNRVTIRDTDTDTDTDIFKKEKEPRHKDFARVCQEYQREIGGLSQAVSDMINDDLESYPADWAIKAMQRAAAANCRRYDYVRGILKNWGVIGGPQNDNPKKPYRNGAKTNGYKRQNNGATSTIIDRADGLGRPVSEYDTA